MNQLNMEPARMENESYEDYQVRRKDIKKAEKRLKHGKEFWDSGYAGTYVNTAKRKLQEERQARRANKRNVI